MARNGQAEDGKGASGGGGVSIVVVAIGVLEWKVQSTAGSRPGI